LFIGIFTSPRTESAEATDFRTVLYTIQLTQNEQRLPISFNCIKLCTQVTSMQTAAVLGNLRNAEFKF